MNQKRTVSLGTKQRHIWQKQALSHKANLSGQIETIRFPLLQFTAALCFSFFFAPVVSVGLSRATQRTDSKWRPLAHPVTVGTV